MGKFDNYINVTAPLHSATTKGKLGNANEIFLEGDTKNIENEIKEINSRNEELNKKHDTLSSKHESLSRTVQGIAATGRASTATNVTYNNDSSELNAENVQDAIDELQSSKVDKISILQELGNAEDKVMSQKVTSTELNKKADKTSVEAETKRAQSVEKAIIYDVSPLINKTYNQSALESNSYRIYSAVVGSVFTGNESIDTCKRIKIHVYKGTAILLSTYAASSPVEGLWNGYVLTNMQDICVVKNVTIDAFNTIDNPIYIEIEQDGYLYTNCNNDYVDSFSIEIISIVDCIYKKSKDYTDAEIESSWDGKIQPFKLTKDKLNYESGYVKDGVLLPHGTVSATDYIQVNSGQEYIIGPNYIQFPFKGSYFNADKEYLSDLSISGSGVASFTPPANAAFVRINISNSELDDTYIYLNGYEDKYILKDLVVQKNQISGNIEPDNGNSTIRYNRLLKPFPLETNKTLVVFGDSITVGVRSTSSYSFANDGYYVYAEVLANAFGWTLNNRAVSGAIASEILNQVTGFSGTADIFLLMLGTNDYQLAESNAKLGSYADVLDNGDTETFYYKVDAIVKSLKARYPSVPIILVSAINFVAVRNVTNTLNKFRNAVQFVATINNVSYIDGECFGFPNTNDKYAEVVMTDGCHPTSLGHLIIGETIANLLR